MRKMRRTRKVKIIAAIMALIMIFQLLPTNMAYAIETAGDQESSESVVLETEALDSENIMKTDANAIVETESETETEAAIETESSAQTEAVTGAESEIKTESGTETEAVMETEFSAQTEAVTGTEAGIQSETEVKSESETEEESVIETEVITESETAYAAEPAADDANSEVFQNLSSTIAAAAKADTNLWNQLLMTMYGGDEESIALLAEQFEVETAVMQQYLQYMGDSFNTLYDVMDEDEDGSLWETMMSAQNDEALLAELAERFGIDAQMLLLFIQYNAAAYQTTELAAAIDTGDTPEYNLEMNGVSYVAFSLNETKTVTTGKLYKQQTSVSGTWNDWLAGIVRNPYTTRYYLINAVSYCASYYTDSTWIQKAKTTFNCSDEEAKTVLRAAIQRAIWFYTDYPNHNYMPTGTTFEKFASDLKDAAYSASGSMPSPFNYNWYVPTTSDSDDVDISKTPNLLVATTGGVSLQATYVGFQNEQCYSNKTIQGGGTGGGTSVMSLRIISYDDYTSASSPEERLDKAQIAYCYNALLHYPANNRNGTWNLDTWGPLINAGTVSGYYNLYAETTKTHFTTDKIKAVALNGYPNNVSDYYNETVRAVTGITKDANGNAVVTYGDPVTDANGNTYKVSDKVNENDFYQVTQNAIWYYTDGNNAWANFRFDDAEAYLFARLISSNLTDVETVLRAENADVDEVESYINLFNPMSQTYNANTGKYASSGDTYGYESDKGYQNLLTVGLRSNAYNLPDEANGYLTVSKTVTGDTINMPDVSFTFEVTLTKDNAAYTDAVSALVTRINAKMTEEETWTPVNGKLTFTLKNSETVQLVLPSGVAYTVKETSIPTGFTLVSPSTNSVTGTISGDTRATAAFTNNFANTVTINGEKTWEGDENDTSSRPAEITLQLWKHVDGMDESTDELVVRDGFDGSFKVTATADGDWIYKFTDMPKYESGKLITYYVKEPNPPAGYEPILNGMNVTNKKTETLQQFDLTLKKVVEGEYADMNTAFSFTITLKDQTGAAVNDSFDVVTSDGVSADSISNGKISFTNGETTVSLAHEQEITIKNLPEGYVYVIQETLDGNQLYNKSIKVNGKSVSGQSEGSTGDRTMSEDETVIYTNRSKDIVPAGIHTNLQSLAVESILVLLLVCGMVCIYTMRRRRK